MAEERNKEKVKYWTVPHLHNLELLHGTYTNHAFTRHIHEGYALGVIEHGALEFTYRGAKLVAPRGFVNLVVPGEAHDGHGASREGWSYRMFYLEPQLLEQAVGEISGRDKGMPFFSAGVLKDDYLAKKIMHLHLLLEDAGTPLAEQQAHLLTLLTEFILRHAEGKFALPGVGRENQAVNRAVDYITEHYRENISLDKLSAICRLSPFHLIRVFSGRVGVPPHVYLKQVRVKRAREYLARGYTPAFVAHETGFADQSHFTKNFKQITGITPRQYRNFVQENSPPKCKN